MATHADPSRAEKQPLLQNGRMAPSAKSYVDESMPSKSQPPEKRQSMFVIACILLTELCERMTFYSISANLVLFCTNKLGFTSPDATTVQYVFTGAFLTFNLTIVFICIFFVISLV